MTKRQKKNHAQVADLYAEAFANLELVHGQLRMLRAKASESQPASGPACSSFRPEGGLDEAPTVECLTPVRRRSLPEEFREALAELLAL